jgi:putative SOS response-associated peptidase YedK
MSTSPATQGNKNWSPRYDIAPTPVPVIRQNRKEPVRKLSLMRWGLVPSWAKDSSAAAQMISALGPPIWCLIRLPDFEAVLDSE